MMGIFSIFRQKKAQTPRINPPQNDLETPNEHITSKKAMGFMQQLIEFEKLKMDMFDMEMKKREAYLEMARNELESEGDDGDAIDNRIMMELLQRLGGSLSPVASPMPQASTPAAAPSTAAAGSPVLEAVKEELGTPAGRMALSVIKKKHGFTDEDIDREIFGRI